MVRNLPTGNVSIPKPHHEEEKTRESQEEAKKETGGSLQHIFFFGDERGDGRRFKEEHVHRTERENEVEKLGGVGGVPGEAIGGVGAGVGDARGDGVDGTDETVPRGVGGGLHAKIAAANGSDDGGRRIGHAVR